MEIKTQKGLPEDSRMIRESVFVQEQKFTNEFDDVDKDAYHVVLYLGDRPAATGRAFAQDEQGTTFLLGRIAVLKEYRKQHLGSRVVAALEAKARELGGGKAVLSAQLQARPFYEKLGYQAVGDVYNDEHCPHIKMEKRL